MRPCQRRHIQEAIDALVDRAGQQFGKCPRVSKLVRPDERSRCIWVGSRL